MYSSGVERSISPLRWRDSAPQAVYGYHADLAWVCAAAFGGRRVWSLEFWATESLKRSRFLYGRGREGAPPCRLFVKFEGENAC